MSPQNQPTRRELLGAVAIGIPVSLAGCTGVTDEPSYEPGTIDIPADADARTAAEFTAAAGVASEDISESTSPEAPVELTHHEFVFESNYLGSTVQGVVENRGDSRIDVAEVRLRVYTNTGSLLGQYTDSTRDLAAGGRWQFVVVILEPPTALESYDIAVLGTPT